ncbi:MAG TPA: toxin-antitoxin system, antitoxin component, Xre family protein [bacterium]|nr:toxin-antitoxin system, antitoxin component, Xre family protein [bacterium]
MKSKKNVLTLIKKIESLPADKISEVEDFVEFLKSKGSDRQLTKAASKLSEKSFARVWDNPEDAIYDKL